MSDMFTGFILITAMLFLGFGFLFVVIVGPFMFIEKVIAPRLETPKPFEINRTMVSLYMEHMKIPKVFLTPMAQQRFEESLRKELEKSLSIANKKYYKTRALPNLVQPFFGLVVNPHEDRAQINKFHHLYPLIPHEYRHKYFVWSEMARKEQARLDKLTPEYRQGLRRMIWERRRKKP